MWPWQWPQGVIYLQRLCPCSFYYTVGLLAPPLLTEMTSKHSREHACTLVCVHLISAFGDTQRKDLFFNHTVVEQSESFCTVQVCITVSTQCAVPPPSGPAQILRMRGVMLPPVTASLKSESTSRRPAARVVKPTCLTFRDFALKTGVLPKFQQDKSVFTRFDQGLQTCPHRPL